MPGSLVDVEKQGSKVLHTCWSRSALPAGGRRVQTQGIEVTANLRSWSGNEELNGRNAKMHVSRSGQLTPLRRSARRAGGDEGGSAIRSGSRARAYLLWEQTGRPDGRADDFWHQAQHQRFCERAYALWEREGCPEGKADEHWFRTRAFEES